MIYIILIIVIGVTAFIIHHSSKEIPDIFYGNQTLIIAVVFGLLIMIAILALLFLGK